MKPDAKFICDKRRRVHEGHTESTPVSALLGNQTKYLVKLAATTMWHGSHIGSLGAGLWGEYECCIQGLFDEHCAFPDLTQGEATIDNVKNLPVDTKKATLVVKAEINGEMYVCSFLLSQMIIVLSAQVLKLIKYIYCNHLSY